MKKKPRILFWIYGFFLHYCLAYHLQSHLDADFFAIIDINSKPKIFFQTQNLVKFQKLWFLHDQIKKTKADPDMDYLSQFERKYGIDLWKLALNERIFYEHNRFYKFSRREILTILEQETKFFEGVLDEINPDYFLTYEPMFHQQKLLLEVCKARGIKVLSISGTGIENNHIITENGATFDLDQSHNVDKKLTREGTNSSTKHDYDALFQDNLKYHNIKISNKLRALMDYLSDSDADLVNSNFMYYGRSKFKVVKDALLLEIRRKQNYKFLQKHSVSSPSLKIPFVYFPMNINMEMNLLHYAPYYTNQIEVIRHIAKSLPVDYVLYVKEHIAAGLRGWNSINYYKQIIEIPNVVLISPNFDNNTLLQNAKLIMTVRGTASLKALKYGKPAIVFGDQPIQIMPSVFKVGSLSALPELIKKALEYKTDPADYDKYKNLLSDRLFQFNTFEFENKRDAGFFSGGIYSNVLFSEKNMTEFIDKNEGMLSGLLNAHLKILSGDITPLK